LPDLPPYKKQNLKYKFPVTKKIADMGMNLPAFASLKKAEIKHICSVIKSSAS